MDFMSLFVLFVIFLLACVFLIFFILMQKGKGDGLAGLMGGMAVSDGLGTPEAQKDLGRWTAYLSGFFFFFCLLITLISARCGGPTESTIDMGDTPAAEAPAALPGADDQSDLDMELVSPEAEIDVDLGSIVDDMQNASPEIEDTGRAMVETPTLEVEIVPHPASGE